MSECKETRDLCRLLESQGAMTYPLVAGQLTPAGWPDRYVAHKKFRGFLEFKTYDGRLDPLQRRIISELHRRGQLAYVIRFNTDYKTVIVENESNLCLSGDEWIEPTGLLSCLEQVAKDFPPEWTQVAV